MTEQAQLVRHVMAEIRRATGRDYRIDLNPLDVASLRELMRVLRDIEHEKRLAARRAQLMPWRRP
jgi:hypothetical protein